ncbi:MAG: TRAP transporter small permease [Syntrophobacteraceae bacterium]
MNRNTKAVFDKVYSFTEILAGTSFALLCIVVALQVASRYLLGLSFAWAEEFPLFLFLWVCFIAAAAAYRQDSHLPVSLLFDRLPDWYQRIARFVEIILTLAFFFIIFYYELGVALSVSATFVIMKFSKSYYFIGIPIAAVLFMIFGFEKLIRLVRERSAIPRRQPDPEFEIIPEK